MFTPTFMNPIFKLIEDCSGIEQLEKYHPEGDVFNHTIQIINIALRESDDVDLIMAAMLHDIGKKYQRSGHEEISVKLARPFSSYKTLWLIEHHMRIWTLLLGDMKKRNKVMYLIEHPWLSDLILLARWDKLSRNPSKRNLKLEKEIILDKLNEKVYNKYNELKGGNGC